MRKTLFSSSERLALGVFRLKIFVRKSTYCRKSSEKSVLVSVGQNLINFSLIITNKNSVFHYNKQLTFFSFLEINLKH